MRETDSCRTYSHTAVNVAGCVDGEDQLVLDTMEPSFNRIEMVCLCWPSYLGRLNPTRSQAGVGLNILHIVCLSTPKKSSDRKSTVKVKNSSFWIVESPPEVIQLLESWSWNDSLWWFYPLPLATRIYHQLCAENRLRIGAVKVECDSRLIQNHEWFLGHNHARISRWMKPESKSNF